MSLPTIPVTSAGAQPTPPATILAQLLALVAATNPGYTANLPGSLVEDISSTDVGAISLINQSAVDTINSLTPFAANPFTLVQLGQIYGVQLGQSTYTSVYCVFTGTVGFPIAPGFTVSDGTYQYVVQDGGVIASGGSSVPLYCLATISGSWPVAANTVTNIVTSVPSSFSLSVTNPETGTPGGGCESQASYAARVLQAGLVSAQGIVRILKTLLGQVPGVQQRLISVLQRGVAYEVIVGGGDPYEVANAIYESLFFLPAIVGSTMLVTYISNTNLAVVTTNLDHGFTSGGPAVTIAGAIPSNFNGTFTIFAIISDTQFSINLNAIAYPPYSSSGILTPNLRNVTASIQDYPNTYPVTFVDPPQQTVTMTVTWNTSAPNFVSPAAIAGLAIPDLVAYVNAIVVGQPMNQLVMDSVFQAAVAPALPIALLTRLLFAVYINGQAVNAEVGTGIIAGDPESYFFAVSSGISVIQG